MESKHPRLQNDFSVQTLTWGPFLIVRATLSGMVMIRFRVIVWVRMRVWVGLGLKLGLGLGSESGFGLVLYVIFFF